MWFFEAPPEMKPLLCYTEAVPEQKKTEEWKRIHFADHELEKISNRHFPLSGSPHLTPLFLTPGGIV